MIDLFTPPPVRTLPGATRVHRIGDDVPRADEQRRAWSAAGRAAQQARFAGWSPEQRAEHRRQIARAARQRWRERQRQRAEERRVT